MTLIIFITGIVDLTTVMSIMFQEFLTGMLLEILTTIQLPYTLCTGRLYYSTLVRLVQ